MVVDNVSFKTLIELLSCAPMELKDFVAESIKQIVDGVVETQTYAATKGAQVNPTHLQPISTKGATVFKDHQGSRFAQSIEFDVAITAGDESNAGVSAGVSVISFFKAGVKGEIAENNTTVSRIKFDIPVLLPNQKA